MTDRRRNLLDPAASSRALLAASAGGDRHEADEARASTSRAASSWSTRASRRRRRRSRPRRSTARSTSCASASTSSASPSPRSSAPAPTRSTSACRASRTPTGAQKQVGTTAQLYFYDWEPNVLGPGCKPDPTNQPRHGRTVGRHGTGRAHAVRRRQRASQVPADERPATTTTERAVLPRSTRRRRRCSPAPRRPRRPPREDLLSQFDGQDRPAPRSSRCPQGTVVVRAEKPATSGQAGRSTATSSSSDNPELERHRHQEPRAELRQRRGRQSGAPIVTFDFTDKGRKAFARRDHAPIAAARARPRRSPAPAGRERVPALRDRARQRDRLARRTSTIEQNPDGIDGRTGAQISGGFTIQEAQDLAERPEDRRAADQARS